MRIRSHRGGEASSSEEDTPAERAIREEVMAIARMAFAEGVEAAQSAGAWGEASSISHIPTSNDEIGDCWIPSDELDRACTALVQGFREGFAEQV